MDHENIYTLTQATLRVSFLTFFCSRQKNKKDAVSFVTLSRFRVPLACFHAIPSKHLSSQIVTLPSLLNSLDGQPCSKTACFPFRLSLPIWSFVSPAQRVKVVPRSSLPRFKIVRLTSIALLPEKTRDVFDRPFVALPLIFPLP